MDYIVRTIDVCREFKSGNDTVHALKHVNIEVEQGMLTILRGRSGSGKTTLINSIGALDKPTSGKVLFDGKEINSISEPARAKLRKTDIGFVFQSVALISFMSAYENVDFGMRLANYKGKDRNSRVNEVLDMVGLSKRAMHMPAEMSGGEQQRVAIARAIAHKPKLIIADEPTAELDTAMGLQVVRLFKYLVEKDNLTVVMTTHDPGLLELAHKVYTLEDGELIDG